MTNVLNPTLYKRLMKYYGHVEVLCRGEAIDYKLARGVEDERRVVMGHTGEYYKLNCPFCNDTRRRLYVNHMYGQKCRDGRRFNFLAICYNENCLSRWDNQQDFNDHIDDTGDLEEARVFVGKKVEEDKKEVLLPGVCTPLDELPDSHPANAYLRDVRKFDSTDLAGRYGLSYCSDSYFTFARNRIIIPVVEKDRLRGWQARYIGDLDWKGPDRKKLPPKYYSCPQSKFRSQCILNFERMKRWQVGVIVEGPTDVFAFGEMSGCVFGNTMTDVQQRKFLAVFRDRTAVFMLDPEEYESKSTQRLIAKFKRLMPKRFAAVKLPDGTDPGSLDRTFQREYVRQEAAEQGVKIVYRRVPEKAA